MVLGFKTHIKGKPTYFVEKILASRIPEYKEKYRPKLHTIRGGNRWKEGMRIHMATGVRTKYYRQFNIEGVGLDRVVSTQKIEILRDYKPTHERQYLVKSHHPITNEPIYRQFQVAVDNVWLKEKEIEQLALNDGFETAADMFEWFNNENFYGQIIHWTELKY